MHSGHAVVISPILPMGGSWERRLAVRRHPAAQPTCRTHVIYIGAFRADKILSGCHASREAGDTVPRCPNVALAAAGHIDRRLQ